MRAFGPNKVDASGIGESWVDLAAVASKINRIEVETASGVTQAQRVNGVWTLPSRDGFPAKEEALQSLVRGLIALKKSQRMTAMPDRHGELGLAWPDATGEARLVRIYEEGSEAPAVEVLVGRSVQSPPGVYVRSPNEVQSWKCTGTLATQELPAAWLDGPVADIPADDLKSIECLGNVLTKENGQWSGKLADGSTHAREAAMRSTLPYLLSGLAIDDARRERPEDLAREGGVTASLRLDDQHTIDARLWRDADAVWVRLAPGECGEGATPEKLAQQSPKWQGWVFMLPKWKAAQYRGLFEDPTPPAPANPAAITPDAGAPAIPLAPAPG